jgi:hypothetical protein
MRAFIAVVALVAIATPTMAQTAVRRTPVQPNLSQYDETFGGTEGERHSINQGYDVYEGGGRYVGPDPDANLRGVPRRGLEHEN